ncbi:MAG: hypothetical protein LBL21_03990 [Rickettsiales bacterium]|nr:hypothetical protein [Rickettsiales bacterium]
MKLAGFIILASILLFVSRANAAVGLCVKDDSLAKAAAANWGGGWGDTWTTQSTDEKYTVDGTASCLSTSSKGGDGRPASWGYGLNCWCKVTRVNNKAVSGAWVFNNNARTSLMECYADCAPDCAGCVQTGNWYSCSRSALFTSP